MKIKLYLVISCALLSVSSRMMLQAMQETPEQALQRVEEEVARLFPQTREMELATQMQVNPAVPRILYDSIAERIYAQNLKGALNLLNISLQRGFNINYQDAQGETLLHKAASAGNNALIQALLERGAKQNVKNQQGETPLFHAVSSRNPDAVRALVRAGGDVNSKNAQGQPLLHYAVQSYNIPVVQALLSAPDVNLLITDPQGKTAYQTIKGRIVLKGKGTGGASPEVQAAMKRLLANTCTQLTDMCVRVITENIGEFTADDLEQLPAEVLEKFPAEIREQLTEN